MPAPGRVILPPCARHPQQHLRVNMPSPPPVLQPPASPTHLPHGKRARTHAHPNAERRPFATAPCLHQVWTIQHCMHYNKHKGVAWSLFADIDELLQPLSGINGFLASPLPANISRRLKSSAINSFTFGSTVTKGEIKDNLFAKGYTLEDKPTCLGNVWATKRGRHYMFKSGGVGGRFRDAYNKGERAQKADAGRVSLPEGAPLLRRALSVPGCVLLCFPGQTIRPAKFLTLCCCCVGLPGFRRSLLPGTIVHAGPDGGKHDVTRCGDWWGHRKQLLNLTEACWSNVHDTLSDSACRSELLGAKKIVQMPTTVIQMAHLRGLGYYHGEFPPQPHS